MTRQGVVPCTVVVDVQLPPSGIEMSKTIYKRAHLREGDPVVVFGRVDRARVEGRVGDRLESCEIAMNPKLAIFLGIMQGDEVNLKGTVAVDRTGSMEAQDFSDILGMSQDRLVSLMGEDLRHFHGLSVEQVLDHLERNGSDHSGRYLVVGPNPDGVGIPVGETCKDLSLDEKIWDPEEN